MANEVRDFIEDPEWFKQASINQLFIWANSFNIENSGEARRQLGYHDGYKGEEPSTRNSDYMRGYKQGLAMRQCNETIN